MASIEVYLRLWLWIVFKVTKESEEWQKVVINQPECESTQHIFFFLLVCRWNYCCTIRAANHPRSFSQTESQRILRDLKTPPPLSHSKMTAMFRLTHNLKHSNKGRLVDSEQDLQIGYGAPSLMTRKYRLQSSESKYVHFNTGIMSEIIMHFTSHHSAAWWLHRKVVRL